MIKTVIEHINAKIAAMPYFTNVYGLCEQRSFVRQSDKTVPARYVDGNWNAINLSEYGAAYWRKLSDVTIDEVENYASCDVDYETTFPLRLFCLTKRSEFPDDDAYSVERLASTIIKGITETGGDLKRNIGARQLTVRATTYSTDTDQIFSEEFTGAKRTDFKSWDLVIALDVNIKIIKSTQCMDDACDYLPSFCLRLETKVAIDA